MDNIIYIIFGDIARDNGDNIHGIYDTIEEAELALQRLETHFPDNKFKIELHPIMKI